MQYLDKDAFFEKYEELHKTLQNEFFKLEALSEYIEYGVQDWNSVTNTSMAEIILAAQKSRFQQKHVFDADKERGVYCKRVRYLRFPLSKYILRQFSTYVISEKIGEEIYIYEDTEERFCSDKYVRDFLLFDDTGLLVHEYDQGELKGAFFSDDKNEIMPYVLLKNRLLSEATPFQEFLKNYNLTISSRL